MPNLVDKQKYKKASMPGVVCQSPGIDKGAEGISCVWCYLIKEGVKKAYSGIRRLKKGSAG